MSSHQGNGHGHEAHEKGAKQDRLVFKQPVQWRSKRRNGEDNACAKGQQKPSIDGVPCFGQLSFFQGLKARAADRRKAV